MTEKAPRPLRSALERGLDSAVSVQRPVVARHVRRLRQRRPDADPAEIIAVLEREYLAAVTGAGAAVGGTAAAPGVGTAVAFALSAGETVGFLDASALLCLAVAEVHGIAIDDLERRRTLLLAVVLGDSGANFVEKAAGRTGGYWGRLLTEKIPTAKINAVNRVLGRWFVTKYGTKQGVIVIGRLAPFGVGAAIGGAGNAFFGRTVIAGLRRAFGPPPSHFTTPPGAAITPDAVPDRASPPGATGAP
jgi:hypothetical protein